MSEVSLRFTGFARVWYRPGIDYTGTVESVRSVASVSCIFAETALPTLVKYVVNVDAESDSLPQTRSW